MIRAVKVDAVPAAVQVSVLRKSGAIIENLRRIQDVRSDTSWARGFRKALGIQLSISARSSIVASVVRCVVAAEASLHFHVLADAVGRVTNEHTEALKEPGQCGRKQSLTWIHTGLKAVTLPLPGDT